MATNIVQMTDGTGNKQYPVTSAEAVGMPDGSGNLTNYLDKRVTEYNVSVLHPTSGSGGSNKYTLETAIAQVPSKYRSVGIKCAFINESGKPECWKYQGDNWAAASFVKEADGGNKILEWKTDAVTTRLQIPLGERKSGMQISYIPEGKKDWVNEQYIGSYTTDAYFKKEENWKKLPSYSDINAINKSFQRLSYNNSYLYTLVNGIPTKVKLNNVLLTKGGLIYKYSDKVSPNSDWCYTEDYIDIKKGCGLLVTTSNMDGQNACLMFYDENKQAILGEFVENFDINNLTDISSLIPDNAFFFRVSCLVADIVNFSIEITYKTDESVYDKISNNKNEIGTETTVLVKGSTLPKSNIAVKWQTGEYTERNAWYSSELTPVLPASELTIKADKASSFGIAFFNDNSNATYISGVVNSGNVETIKVPEKANYFAWCTQNIDDSSYVQYRVLTGIKYDISRLKDKIDKNAEDITKLHEDIAFILSEEKKYNYFDSISLLSQNEKILGLGASYMRGNEIGNGMNNSWLFTMAKIIGLQSSNVINDALGGTNIMYHANRLYNGDILSDSGVAPISDVGAILIMHAHDKDVYTLPEEFQNYSAKDYESNGILPFQYTTGTTQADVEYAKAFDYVIKKIKDLYFNQKLETQYTEEVRQYMGDYYVKPCQIVLATHWHDARAIYNLSIRKLANKWGLPLVRFDEKVGFNKNTLNPSTNYQASLEYVGNIGGASPTETISGTIFGWHPMCGDNDVYIQKKLAVIAAQSFTAL